MIKSTVGQNEILEAIYDGRELGFNNVSHLHNFVRYLFGAKSGRHTINEHSKNNVYTENMQDFLFTEKPLELSAEFINKYKKEFSNPSDYMNDEMYIPFLLNVNGKLITNFLTLHESGEPILMFGDGDPVGEALFDRFEGGKDGFIGEVERILSLNNGKFVFYNDCLGEDRLFIEEKIQKHCAALSPKDFIISISHDDQFESHPMYHLHRMYRVAEEGDVEENSFQGIPSLLG